MSVQDVRDLKSESETKDFVKENDTRVVVILIYDPISGPSVEQQSLIHIRERFAEQERAGAVIFARISTRNFFYDPPKPSLRMDQGLAHWRIFYKGQFHHQEQIYTPTPTFGSSANVILVVDQLTRQLASTTSSACGATATVTVTQYEATLTVTVDSAGTPAERRRWAYLRGRAAPTGRVDPWRRAEPRGRVEPAGFIRRFRP